MLDYESCCRLLETLILVSGQGKMPKVYSKIAEKVFKAKLLAFAVHPTGNYPLQKLVSNCPDKELFEGWYSSEFDEHLEEILAEGNSGVVLSIAQACRRLNAKQVCSISSEKLAGRYSFVFFESKNFSSRKTSRKSRFFA